MAYGNHLLSNVFGIRSSDIRVSGRNAVGFLSKSNLDRAVLRTLWTVADPAHAGSVQSTQQWLLLLRLVALGQSDPVLQSMPADQVTAETLQTALWQSLTQQSRHGGAVPLAVFEGVPIPSAMMVTTAAVPGVSVPAVATAVQGWGGLGAGSSPSVEVPAAAEPSGWGALDALSTPLQNAPLPSLQQQSTPIATTIAATDDDDEFGDFASTIAPAATRANEPSSMLLPTQPHDVTHLEPSGWGALDAPQTTTSNVVMPASSLSSVSVPSFGGGAGTLAGGFDSSLQQQSAVGGASAATVVPEAATGWDALDALQPPVNAPLPSLSSDATFAPYGGDAAPADNDDDDFGDFADAPASLLQPTSSQTAQVVAEPTGWSALDALQPPVDVPLPSFSHQLSAISSVASMRSQDGDDDFGDFDMTEKALAPVAGFVPETTVATLPVVKDPSCWDALDALQPPVDAPLPSLSHQSSAISSVASMQSQDDDDDFGDFTGTNETNSETTTTETAPAPLSTENMVATKYSGWGALDALQPPLDAPLPSLSHQSSAMSNAPSQDDDFGDFLGTGSDETSIKPLDTTVEVSSQEPVGWDALDALQAPVDLPLPSLSHQSSAVSNGPSVDDDDDDDEFGDFAGPGSSETRPEQVDESYAAAPVQGKSGLDALDTLSAPSNAPPPTLSQQLPVISSNPSMQSDFGVSAAGEGTEPLTEQPTESTETLGWNAMDVLPAVQNAPLPSLESLSFEVAPAPLTPDNTGRQEESSDRLQTTNIVRTFGNEDIQPSLGTEPALSRDDAALVFRSSDKDSVASIHANTTPGASTKKPPLPPSASRLVPNMAAPQYLPAYDMERTDSAFYSARTNSIATTNEDLGDFQDAVQGIDESDWQGTGDAEVQAVVSSTVDSEDPFAAFDSMVAPSSVLLPLPTYHTQSQGSDPTSDKSSTKDDDIFGDFEAISPAKDVTPSDIQEDRVGIMDGDFGDFTNSEPPPAIGSAGSGFLGFAATQPSTSGESTDYLGGLEVPPADMDALNLLDTAAVDDDFGDFEGVGSFQDIAPLEIGAGDKDNEFGDFASFGETGSTPPALDIVPDQVPESNLNDPERKKLGLIRAHLVAQSQQLPDALRTQLNTQGNRIDFGDCFDANIGLETPVSEERKSRAQRCAQLLGLLSSSHSKLASTFWAQAIEVARDELAMGSLLLEEASGLSATEKQLVRQPLQTMFHGLGEFVRVVRSIAATIGDLLMLDDSALLTIDTFASSWCSSALLKNVLEVENIWKGVKDLAAAVGLDSKAKSTFALESIVHVRTRATAANSSGPLCQFTLQPLSKEDVGKNTKSAVTLKGAPYMASTANFLLHKCAFYAIQG